MTAQPLGDLTRRRRTTKLGVVGAGAVGATMAYAALMRGVAQNVALFDVNAAKVHAEALDLSHAHPSGLATLLAGRPTPLSMLFREPAVHSAARRRSRGLRTVAGELASDRGVRAGVRAVDRGGLDRGGCRGGLGHVDGS